MCPFYTNLDMPFYQHRTGFVKVTWLQHKMNHLSPNRRVHYYSSRSLFIFFLFWLLNILWRQNYLTNFHSTIYTDFSNHLSHSAQRRFDMLSKTNHIFFKKKLFHKSLPIEWLGKIKKNENYTLDIFDQFIPIIGLFKGIRKIIHFVRINFCWMSNHFFFVKNFILQFTLCIVTHIF